MFFGCLLTISAPFLFFFSLWVELTESSPTYLNSTLSRSGLVLAGFSSNPSSTTCWSRSRSRRSSSTRPTMPSLVFSSPALGFCSSTMSIFLFWSPCLITLFDYDYPIPCYPCYGYFCQNNLIELPVRVHEGVYLSGSTCVCTLTIIILCATSSRFNAVIRQQPNDSNGVSDYREEMLESPAV